MIRPLIAWCLLAVTLGSAVHAATVSGRIRRNPKLVAGGDDEGRVLLYTPRPVRPGSTHSHFDSSASPNLLMEPSIVQSRSDEAGDAGYGVAAGIVQC